MSSAFFALLSRCVRLDGVRLITSSCCTFFFWNKRSAAAPKNWLPLQLNMCMAEGGGNKNPFIFSFADFLEILSKIFSTDE